MPRRGNSPYHPHVPTLSAALGDVPGVTYRSKYGYNGSVSTAFREIWNGGASYPGLIAAASAVQIQSGGNANDTAAGSGARSIYIEGILEDGTYGGELLVTAGASASAPSVNNYWRVQRAYVVDVGTFQGANEGNIVVETTGGVVLSVIAAGNGQTEACIFTVPINQRVVMNSLHIHIEGNKEVELEIRFRPNITRTSAPYSGERLSRHFLGVTGTMDIEQECLPVFGELTDVWVQGKTASGTAGVSATMGLFYVDD